WGPFASWTIPLVFAVPLVNFLIFGRLLGAWNVMASAQKKSPVNVRSVIRYFAGDFLGTLFFMAASGLTPILVLEQAGAEANAVYYLTWTITYSLYLVSKSMGVSLVAEGAADPWRAKALAASTLAHTMGLLIIAVAALVVAAPLILELFGHSYAANGVALLRVLSISALPFSFTSMFLGLARVEGRMRALLMVQGALMLAVLGLGVPLLHAFGTLGMGFAWLIAQAAIALVLGVVVWRSTGWSHAALHALVGRPVMREPSALLRPLRRFLVGQATANLARDATRRIADARDARPWRCQGIRRTNRQSSVLALGPHLGRTTALLRVANSSEGIAALRRQSEALRAFRSEPGLRNFCELLPIVLAEGHGAGSAYIVEQPVLGEPGNTMSFDDGRRERALASAANAITELHSRTASKSGIDQAWLSDWIDPPIEPVLGAAPPPICSAGAIAALEVIRQYQRSAWTDRNLPLGWSHGEFSLANLRYARDGSRVTGITGWAQARRNAPAALDLCH